MIEVELIVSFIVGAIFASVITSIRAKSFLNVEIKVLEERLISKEESLERMSGIQNASDRRIDQLLDEKGSLREKLSELEARLTEERRSSSEKLRILEESRKSLRLEFKELANKILEHNSQKMSAQNKERLEVLLNPLKDEIGKFKKKVEETYEKETRERFSLKNEITNLQKVSAQMSKETLNLTNALKGDVKQQGAWGEVILERILESSGLEKDREYFTQFSLKNEDGQLQRPDVLIRLPDSKDVVIDSKVSLVAYEKFASEDNPELKKQYAREHLLSVEAHIKGLSSKAYQDIPDLKTLDYVLLFMPMEGAFRLALEENERLLLDAMKKNVMLVGPSTLLVSLRIINKLWQYENQNQFAQAIARKAEQLHRKFVLFVQELQKVGDALDSAGKHYDEAFKRLSTGRGNLVKLSTDLEKLGVKSKEELPGELLELSGALVETDSL
ncbi:MAG: DNA recombination protein RmuC [Lentisphaerales bacterium]|nr:DNA recombination protein RmuC [Lentisphaerales bacterium]